MSSSFELPHELLSSSINVWDLERSVLQRTRLLIETYITLVLFKDQMTHEIGNGLTKQFEEKSINI